LSVSGGCCWCCCFCLHVCYATHVLVCFHWGGQRSGEWQPVAKSQKCVAKIKCDATEKPSYRASELGGFQWLLRWVSFVYVALYARHWVHKQRPPSKRRTNLKTRTPAHPKCTWHEAMPSVLGCVCVCAGPVWFVLCTHANLLVIFAYIHMQACTFYTARKVWPRSEIVSSKTRLNTLCLRFVALLFHEKSLHFGKTY